MYRDAHNHIKRVKLPAATYGVDYLNLIDPYVPATWTVTIGKRDSPFAENSGTMGGTSTFLDIGFDMLGRREYISLDEAKTMSSDPRKKLVMYKEDDIKAMGKVGVFFGSYFYGSSNYNEFNIGD